MKKRILAIVLACSLILAVSPGCGNGGTEKETAGGADSQSTESTASGQAAVHDTDYDDLDLTVTPGTGSKEKASELPVPDGYTVVEFWHSMGDKQGETLEEIAMDFNNTVGKKKKIWVKPTFQGTYDDTALKLESVLASGDVSSYPDIVNVNANGMILMLDTPEFITFSDLAARDADYSMEDLNQNALNTLRYKDQIMSFPLSVSIPPLLYYNKDMFKAAGLDPEKLPETLEEYADLLPKLTKRNAKNEIQVYGMATSPELMHLQNWLPMQKGAEYMFDNKSGHEGPPTKPLFGENGSMLNLLNSWKKLVDTGCLDYFSNAGAPAFRNKQAAIVMLSSAQIQNLVNTPPDFDWGVVKLPKINKDDYEGRNTGGSSLFMIDRGEEQLSAVWAFIKFMSLPEPSGKWYLGSGYFPHNMKAFDLPEVKKVMEEHPQTKVLPSVYKDSIDMPFLSPIWVPSFGALNKFYKDTFVDFGKGKYTSEEAVKVMVDESQRILDDYNRLNGGK